MRVSVVIFPGTNCDHDVVHTFRQILGQEVREVWHRERDLCNPDLVVLPGGFAYGDYLRTGALAKVSPAMEEVQHFAKRGGAVLGICNGFQILCEVGLLPGALLRNVSMKFISRFICLRVETNSTFVTKGFESAEIFCCPIAHGEGNYFADEKTLDALESSGRVIFRYCSEQGEVDETNRDWNPNGSARAIAGICNEGRNVIGFMPHPERVCERIVGGEQSLHASSAPERSRALFESALKTISG